MPYIPKKLRGYIDCYIIQIINNIKNKSDGKVNEMMTYTIYKLIKEYDRGGWNTKSDPLKILIDVLLEYYRRILVPHAELKIEENGDI